MPPRKSQPVFKPATSKDLADSALARLFKKQVKEEVAQQVALEKMIQTELIKESAQESETLSYIRKPSILPGLAAVSSQANNPEAGDARMSAIYQLAKLQEMREAKKYMSRLQPKRDMSRLLGVSEMPGLTGKRTDPSASYLGGLNREVAQHDGARLTTKVGDVYSMYERVKMLSLYPNIYNS